MGQALSKLIKSIDGSSDSEQETKDALNALFELGKSRNDAAFAKATSDAMKVYVPIQKILLQRQSIVANVATGTDGIVSGIKDSVGNLMKGKILDGVTDLIGNALNVVLGASSGQVSETYTYALVATDLGALLRIDIDVYSFEIKSKGLQNHAKTMTAITSIVSTVDGTKLRLSDIRGVVSMSYGSSTPEKQKEIFDLVTQAWEMDRKISMGQSVLSIDHESFASKLGDSDYERQMISRGTLGKSFIEGERSPPKVRREDLVAALSEHKASSKAQGFVISSLEKPNSSPTFEGTSPLRDPQVNIGDVLIWVHLIDQAESEWFKRMAGALTGFNEPEMFTYKGSSPAQSGKAVSFLCRVHEDEKLFDRCISYCNDIILPAISNAPYLSQYIKNMALQYTHPSSSHTGFITKITYKENQITNASGDVITFMSPNKMDPLLSLQPGESKNLSGTVNYLTGVLPPPPPPKEGDKPNGTVPEKPKETAEDSSKPSPKPQWATYQNIKSDQIITGVAARLSKFPSGGYLLDMHTGNDKVLQISYNSPWTQNF